MFERVLSDIQGAEIGVGFPVFSGTEGPSSSTHALLIVVSTRPPPGSPRRIRYAKYGGVSSPVFKLPAPTNPADSE